MWTFCEVYFNREKVERKNIAEVLFLFESWAETSSRKWRLKRKRTQNIDIKNMRFWRVEENESMNKMHSKEIIQME